MSWEGGMDERVTAKTSPNAPCSKIQKWHNGTAGVCAGIGLFIRHRENGEREREVW